jgi:hypothetical protein
VDPAARPLPSEHLGGAGRVLLCKRVAVIEAVSAAVLDGRARSRDAVPKLGLRDEVVDAEGLRLARRVAAQTALPVPHIFAFPLSADSSGSIGENLPNRD